MPIPTGGLLEVTLNQTYGSRNLANVFYYWNASNTEPTSFVTLLSDFNTKIVEQLKALQSSSIGYTSVKFRTVLGTLPDLVGVPSSSVGTLAGEVLPSYVAFSFNYQGTTKETRRGAKRFAGITEPQINGNVIDSGFVTLMDTFTTQLELDLDSGVTTYAPVIYSPFTKTRATKLVNLVTEITSVPIISHQVSR